MFGSSSSFEPIGVSCFELSGVEEASTPDGVRESCDCCFQWCRNLRRVTFGSLSSLDLVDACFQLVRLKRRVFATVFVSCVMVVTKSARVFVMTCASRGAVPCWLRFANLFSTYATRRAPFGAIEIML